jgi:hypothetical protein
MIYSLPSTRVAFLPSIRRYDQNSMISSAQRCGSFDFFSALKQSLATPDEHRVIDIIDITNLKSLTPLHTKEDRAEHDLTEEQTLEYALNQSVRFNVDLPKNRILATLRVNDILKHIPAEFKLPTENPSESDTWHRRILPKVIREDGLSLIGKLVDSARRNLMDKYPLQKPFWPKHLEKADYLPQSMQAWMPLPRPQIFS